MTKVEGRTAPLRSFLVMVRLVFICLLSIMSCETKNKSIDIYSHDVKTKEEKINILKEYLNIESGLIDAEYHIWFKDNSGGMVPGPSDYNLTLALRIAPDSLDNWTRGLKRSEPTGPIHYWDKLKLDWDLTSTPEYYFSDYKNQIKMVYRKEGVILAKYSTMMIYE
jgi:hypothetical protein